MKTLAVNPGPGKPTILVRTGDVFETFEFRTKRQADKKILELIEVGYKFDAYLWASYTSGNRTS